MKFIYNSHLYHFKRFLLPHNARAVTVIMLFVSHLFFSNCISARENLDNAGRVSSLYYTGIVEPQCRIYTIGTVNEVKRRKEYNYIISLTNTEKEQLIEAELLVNKPSFFSLDVYMNLTDDLIEKLKKASFTTSIRVGLPLSDDKSNIKWEPWRSFTIGVSPVYEIKSWAIEPRMKVQIKHRTESKSEQYLGIKSMLSCVAS